MTEADWRTTADPRAMLAFLRGRASARKIRLATCGCARRVFWADLPDPRSRAAVEVAERHADGATTDAERRAAWDAAQDAVEGLMAAARLDDAFAAAVARACAGGPFDPDTAVDRYTLDMVTELCDDLRDVLGPLPFRPVAFDPSWRTEAAVGLARGTDESRDFGPLPVLADALEDAGCGDADVLAHCRGVGMHVRGCWVVDLVLTKD